MGRTRYQEKVAVKDGKGKVVIKNRCNGNRNADDLCDSGFFEWLFPLSKLLENCFEIICRQGLRCRGRRYVFVEIRIGSFPVWVRAAWRCSLSFSVGACLALAKHSDLSIVPFTRVGVAFLCLLVFVCICVHQNPCEVPVVLSATLLWEEGKKKQRKWDDWQ